MHKILCSIILDQAEWSIKSVFDLVNQQPSEFAFTTDSLIKKLRTSKTKLRKVLHYLVLYLMVGCKTVYCSKNSTK